MTKEQKKLPWEGMKAGVFGDYRIRWVTQSGKFGMNGWDDIVRCVDTKNEALRIAGMRVNGKGIFGVAVAEYRNGKFITIAKRERGQALRVL